MTTSNHIIFSMLETGKEYEIYLKKEISKLLYKQVETTLGKDTLQEKMQQWKVENKNIDFATQLSFIEQMNNYLRWADVLGKDNPAELRVTKDEFEKKFGSIPENVREIMEKQKIVFGINDRLIKIKNENVDKSAHINELKQYVQTNEQILKKRRTASTKFWRAINDFFKRFDKPGYQFSKSMYAQFKAFDKVDKNQQKLKQQESAKLTKK